MLSGASQGRPVIVGWSIAPCGQVIEESLGQLPKKLAAGPRVLPRTESSRSQLGTKQGGPPHDHWAKLGQLPYTRSQYAFVERREYDLHKDILQCDALARVHSRHGTRLLPLAFPEGCPTHPSYPSAHACNAGACATVLKAFFDPDYVLSHPVEASADGMILESWRGAGLTLGNEIDKLACNIDRDRGEPLGSAPPTPPYVRVRIRRFEKLR
jgi:hypothetical protein